MNTVSGLLSGRLRRYNVITQAGYIAGPILFVEAALLPSRVFET